MWNLRPWFRRPGPLYRISVVLSVVPEMAQAKIACEVAEEYGGQLEFSSSYPLLIWRYLFLPDKASPCSPVCRSRRHASCNVYARTAGKSNAAKRGISALPSRRSTSARIGGNPSHGFGVPTVRRDPRKRHGDGGCDTLRSDPPFE